MTSVFADGSRLSDFISAENKGPLFRDSADMAVIKPATARMQRYLLWNKRRFSKKNG